MNRKIKILAIPLIFFLFAAVYTIVFVKKQYDITEATVLNCVIQKLTAGYRVKQIIATMVMFQIGVIISVPLCKQLGDKYALILAMPVGNAVWGLLSALITFLNIPYTSLTMASIIIAINSALIYVFRKEYKASIGISFAIALIIVLAITLMASSGVFPIFMSSDSYYYIMQYGQLIEENAGLSSDIVGNFMTWTGISGAYISSYAAMWGFENIYAIHYLLVFSMYGFIIIVIYDKSRQFCQKSIAIVLSILSLLSVITIIGVSFLSMWVISNTYFMIYLVYLLMIPEIIKERIDMRTICIMSIFAAWLTLCRIEAAPAICFFIICMSYLKIPRKQICVLYFSSFLFEGVYLLKVLLDNLSGAKQASMQDLTLGTAGIILLAYIVTGIYLSIFNWKIIAFIRKHMTVFGYVVLLLINLILGLRDLERFQNNIIVSCNNMFDWYWMYVPFIVLVLEIVKTCMKCRNQYFDLVVGGFILFNFAICMGRTHFLRIGIGDSYNRICMSIIPLYIVSSIYTLVQFYGKNLRMRKEVMAYERESLI